MESRRRQWEREERPRLREIVRSIDQDIARVNSEIAKLLREKDAHESLGKKMGAIMTDRPAMAGSPEFKKMHTDWWSYENAMNELDIRKTNLRDQRRMYLDRQWDTKPRRHADQFGKSLLQPAPWLVKRRKT
jgi:hypothetical protein